MKMNELRRKIGGAALMLAMMIGISIAASETAQAQYRDNDRYGRYEDNNVRWSRDRERQYAFVLGYHNAYTEGRDRGRSMDYRQSQTYRNNDNGYRPWMGDVNTYRDNYRRGAEAGFKDGESGRARRYDRQDVERLLGARMVDVYGESDDNGWWGDRDRDRGRGNGRWDDRGNNRNDAYRIAQQNGYRDGVRHGQEDRSRNRRFDSDNSSDYRDASRGYRSEYGNREAYRNAYRDGFRQGYDDGYRNNRNNSRFPWPF